MDQMEPPVAKLTLLLAALFGATGVALGALAAHGLKAKLAQNLLEAFKTGVHYQQVHALALLGIGLLALHVGQSRALSVSASMMVVGIVFFSGSLYWLALGGPRWLGPVTPLGGTLLIGAWIALAVAVLKIP